MTRLRDSFAALRERPFRLLFTGQLFRSPGTGSAWSP